MSYFKSKINYRLNIDGKSKKMNEEYIVLGESFTDAEANINAHLHEIMKNENDPTIKTLGRENINIVRHNADKELPWFKVKARYFTEDDNGSPKKAYEDIMYLQSESTQTASKLAAEIAKEQTMYTNKIMDVKYTTVVGVYDVNAEVVTAQDEFAEM